MKVNYQTITAKLGKYKISATQRKRDGKLEGGYNYVIQVGKHMIDFGHMSCAKFIVGVDKEEILTTLKNYISRYEE